MILTSEVLLLGKEHELIKTGSGLCVVVTITQTKFALQRRIARTVIIVTGRSSLPCRGKATAAGLANEVL